MPLPEAGAFYCRRMPIFTSLNLIKKLLDWFLLTSTFTACCALSLCMATERLVNDSRPELFSKLHALVFGCSLLVYNIHPDIKKRVSSTIGLPRLTRHHQPVYAMLAGAGVLLAASALPEMTPNMFLVCALLGFISFAYTLPILPFKKKKRIRDVGWLKILSLTAVWTIVTSVLPMLYWHVGVQRFPFEILLRGTFIFALCIIFDIRDVQADKNSNINTLPHIIGLPNSYRLMNAALLLFGVLGLVQYLRHPLWYRMGAVVITAMVTRFVAEYLKTHNTERAYLVYADGMMMLYALLVLLL